MNKMLKMTPRMKLMHGFVQYVHHYGLQELEWEERRAKENACKARAKKRVKEII